MDDWLNGFFEGTDPRSPVPRHEAYPDQQEYSVNAGTQQMYSVNTVPAKTERHPSRGLKEWT